MAEKKTLKMVCDYNPDAKKLIEEAVQENEFNLDRNSWWFLHGKLEALCGGYDKATVLNLSEFPEYQGDTLKWTEIQGDIAIVQKFEKKKEMKINGIIPVKVVGVDEPCIGYFWITDEKTVTAVNEKKKEKQFQYWSQKGYVCLASDIEGCAQAKEEYDLEN